MVYIFFAIVSVCDKGGCHLSFVIHILHLIHILIQAASASPASAAPASAPPPAASSGSSRLASADGLLNRSIHRLLERKRSRDR